MKTKINRTELLKECELTGNIEISPQVHLITFKRPWNFIPGQVVKIALKNNEIPRIYSICSGNNGIEAAILFNIKTDGQLTPKLSGMNAGEKILVSEPYGTFSDTGEPAWWIATGTGIAPFYSMLHSGLGNSNKLIHGVSFLNQFYFEKEFEEKLGSNYIKCCSRESGRKAFHGRVTDYVSEIKQLPDIKYLICGKAEMVVEMRDILISKGIRFENISAEIYF